MEGLLGLSLSDRALAGAPALAVWLFPACGPPIRTQPDVTKQRSLAPYSSKPAPDHRAGCTGASPESRRITSDPGSEVLRRVSGEAPARLRWDSGGMRGRQGTLLH